MRTVEGSTMRVLPTDNHETSPPLFDSHVESRSSGLHDELWTRPCFPP